MTASREEALSELVDIFESVTPLEDFGRTPRAEYVALVRDVLFEGRNLLEGAQLGLVSPREVALSLLDRLERLAHREMRPWGTTPTARDDLATVRMMDVLERLAALETSAR